MARIHSNYQSLGALTSLGRTQAILSQWQTRLATGRRINSGHDDPAGLMAAESLQGQIVESSAAITSNARSGLMLKTADTALGQMSAAIRDIGGLAAASANAGAMAPGELQANQQMIDAAVDAVNRIATTANSGGRQLLDGSLKVQVLPGGQGMSIPKVHASTLGQPGSDFPGQSGGQTLDSIRTGGANSLAKDGGASAAAIATQAATQVATLRGQIGTFQKYAVEGSNALLEDTRLNLVAAKSSILDTDMAEATAQTTASQIAAKSGLLALGLTNRNRSSLLDLLQLPRTR